MGTVAVFKMAGPLAACTSLLDNPSTFAWPVYERGNSNEESASTVASKTRDLGGPDYSERSNHRSFNRQGLLISPPAMRAQAHEHQSMEQERVAPVIASDRVDAEARKAAACRAFWSDAPLNVRYREAVGDRPFSLKEFVQFVLAMPPDQFSAVNRE